MLNRILQPTENAIANFHGADRWIGSGRTLIALAQLSILCFTPTAYLFVPVSGEPQKPHCEGWKGLTAYCLGNDDFRPWVSILLIALLMVVASGFFPALTAVPHYWATVSISTGISLPDGGEAAAQVITLFLVFLLLGDRRKTHWHRASPSTRPRNVLLGLTWAAHWGLRLQMAWIYVNAAIPKLSVQEWKDGTAVYYITRGEFFGAPKHLQELIYWATSMPLVELLLTWGTIAAELTIAYFLIFGKNRTRLVSLALCVALHAGIIAVIGLWSFALVMIGGVAAAMAGIQLRQQVHAPGAPRSAPITATPADFTHVNTLGSSDKHSTSPLVKGK